MQRVRLGPLSAHITGGTDREGGGSGPVVVLLHGFGAPGDDLVPLWRVLDAPAGTRFVFPEAPHALPAEYGPGRAWWMIDMVRLQMAMAQGSVRDLSKDEPEGLAEARDAVISMLDELETKLGVSGSRIVLGGFSQGAMLSCDVALRTDRPLAGLVLWSGTLLAEQEWAPRMPQRKGLPIFQSHGKDDPLLPFSAAERLKNALQEAGASVEWLPFRGGHGIPPEVMEAMGPFLKRALAG